MIIGVGTDLVQIKRIERIYSKYRDIFKNRILGVSEIEKFDLLKEPLNINYLAKRFAAKEAVSKAFGIGISENLLFKDIEILNDKFGKPYVNICNKKMCKIIDIVASRDSDTRNNSELSNSNNIDESVSSSQPINRARKLKIDLSIAGDYPVAIAFSVISINGQN